MAEYRTFMVDPLGALQGGLGYDIQSRLAGLFSAVASEFFENNWVLFDPVAAAPVEHELLVYFMPAGLSIVKNVPNHKYDPDPTGTGYTAIYAGASEVYVKNNDPMLLANLAFHELMHNRLKRDNHKLHPQGGLAAKEISASTQMNDRNKRSMAAVIRHPIRQWTDGITILNNGRYDPTSEYYQI